MLARQNESNSHMALCAGNCYAVKVTKNSTWRLSMSDLAAQPTSVQSVYSWYSNDQLFVNRRYQRKLVWTLEEKQKLIDSILKKYPIPAILIAETKGEDTTFEIIDGLQRLHAIVSFIETAFPTVDGRLFNLELFPTAQIRAKEGCFIPNESENHLTQKEVSTILDYALALSVMRNASETEVNDVFDRINTYGHRLSDQERRQSGIQNDFSNMVRDIACTIRGDESINILPLASMPSISIDLPMARHGYNVQADEVFWVTQGILRSTDLRDSMDEQCIADISACIVGGQLIERSKDALDQIYAPEDENSDRVLGALKVYGAEKFSDEFKFCVDEILKVCHEGKKQKLRDLVFETKNTNPFPAVFAVILIAFHELIFNENKIISNYSGIKKAMGKVGGKLDRGRKAASADERRKSIDQVRGLISRYFVSAKKPPMVYGAHATSDINSAIRRSEIELSDYELKQGLVTLGPKRTIDSSMITKVIQTICAIANNGPNNTGKIIIGVSNKPGDTARIKRLDGIKPIEMGHRSIVGVDREATVLGITVEEYYAKWKDGIKNSSLSLELKTSILSSIDYNSYFGLGIIIITIPPQRNLSFVGEDLYWRNGDSTELVKSQKLTATLAQRF